MGRKFLIFGLVFVIVGGTLGTSKPDDAQILTRTIRVAAYKVGEAMPERSKIAGPINSLRTDDSLPATERVRMRIRTDKSMDGADLTVLADGNGVKLRGSVQNPSQRIRALELAQSTAGVEQVTNEIVEPAN